MYENLMAGKIVGYARFGARKWGRGKREWGAGAAARIGGRSCLLFIAQNVYGADCIHLMASDKRWIDSPRRSIAKKNDEMLSANL